MVSAVLKWDNETAPVTEPGICEIIPSVWHAESPTEGQCTEASVVHRAFGASEYIREGTVESDSSKDILRKNTFPATPPPLLIIYADVHLQEGPINRSDTTSKSSNFLVAKFDLRGYILVVRKSNVCTMELLHPSEYFVKYSADRTLGYTEEIGCLTLCFVKCAYPKKDKNLLLQQ
jgi:hypothetical protein